jgi:nucleotide-binding universal stress UspA family protein
MMNIILQVCNNNLHSNDEAKALPTVTAADLQAAAYHALETALAEAEALRDRDQAGAFLFYSVRSPHRTAEDRYSSNSAANRRLQDKTENWELAQAARRAADRAYQDLSKRSNDQGIAALTEAWAGAREGGGA